MRVRQLLQRPRSTTHETSGTLSYHAILWLHDMHAEGGETIERRSGTRAATTFRNEPSASAGAKNRLASAKSMCLVSAAGVPWLRDGRLLGPGGVPEEDRVGQPVVVDAGAALDAHLEIDAERRERRRRLRGVRREGVR